MKAISLAVLAGLVVTFALSTAVDAQTLYWIETNYSTPQIGRSDVNGAGVTKTGLSVGQLPEGLDFDPDASQLYWVEAAWTDARVMRSESSFLNPTEIHGNGTTYRDIALDPDSNLMYWTSSNLNNRSKIHRSAMNGGPQTLILTGLPTSIWRGIDIDVVNGYLYWADFGNHLIWRGNLAGTVNVPIVILTPGVGPWGIAVDSKFVYWSEYNNNRIKRANLDGTGVTTIIGDIPNPTYLALDDDNETIFWVEAGMPLQHIRKADKDGNNVQTLPIPYSTYGGLVVAPMGVVSVPSEPAPQYDFALAAPAPNPAMGSTVIQYTLPQRQTARVTVFDVQGRVAAVLHDGLQEPGKHVVHWDGRTKWGTAAAGLYFVAVESQAGRLVQRLVWLR